MNKFHDLSPKTRLLKILLLIIESPFGYTKKQLAQKYDVHEDTIKNDFEEIRNAGFTLEIDDKYRYGLGNDKALDTLKEMMYVSEEDQNLMVQALQSYKSDKNKVNRLVQKLEYIHDVSVLGNRIFNRAHLTKVSLLEKFRKSKKTVILKDYRSTNSSKLTDRTVEVYHISQREDIIQGWDWDKKAARHFKISRIGRIEPARKNWENESKHVVMATDPFGIELKQQKLISVKMKIGGYNELIERFPLTLSYIQQSPDQDDVFIFEGMVNDRFIGISNFILGYFEYIIEIQPQSLADHIMKMKDRINL